MRNHEGNLGRLDVRTIYPGSNSTAVPRGLTKKLKMRAEKVAHLLHVRGCVRVKDVVALGYTRAQAKHALQHLASEGRAAYLLVGGVLLWCCSGSSARRHVGRLRRALHDALCAAGVKFVTPRRAIRILLNDKKAGKIFSRYVALRDVAAVRLVSGLLELTYGGPAYYRTGTRTPVYWVRCGRKPPPLRVDIKGARPYVKLTIKVEKELKEALERLVAARGVPASMLVEHAVRQLLRRHKTDKPYRNVKVKLDAQLHRDLRKAAEALGVSTSALVRLAVELLLKRHKSELNSSDASA